MLLCWIFTESLAVDQNFGQIKNATSTLVGVAFSYLESVDKIDIRYRGERKTVIKKKPRTQFARRGSRLARPKGCRNDCVVPERADSPQDGAPPHVSSLKTCHRHVF